MLHFTTLTNVCRTTARPKLIIHFAAQPRLSATTLLEKVAVMLVHFLLLLARELTSEAPP